LAVTSPSIPDLSKATLHGFIKESIMPCSTVRTDGFPSYPGLEEYNHEPQVQRHQEEGEHVLPRVHLVISQLKRWLLGTHQGAVGYDHLDDYLNEFMFRFNRRKSASRGKLFYRLAQQVVQIDPVPFASLIKPQQVGPGGVK
jgi:transposase-like protein